jgi:uncharacterized damage-inducible protein DinB
VQALDELRRLFDYDEWANREVLAALRRSGDPSARALRWLSHILAAQRLWHARLTDQTPPVVWPEWTLAECETEIEAVAFEWASYLETLTPERLDAPVPYRNTKGEPWTNTVRDILTHVVMHSAYHRGQIAADLRASGHEPAVTDFIHAVRQGHLEPSL